MNFPFSAICLNSLGNSPARAKSPGLISFFPKRVSSNFTVLKMLTKAFIETATGAALHQFQYLADPDIGDLPKEWNMLDSWNKDGKIIHYTQGGPWLTQYRNHPYGSIYFREFYEMVHG